MSHHFFVMWSKLLTPTQKRQMAPSLWLSSRQCYLTCRRRVWPKANQRRSKKNTTFMHNKTKFGIFKIKETIYSWVVFWRIEEGKGIVLQKENPRTPQITVEQSEWLYVRYFFKDAEWSELSKKTFVKNVLT